jgi:hypothetical protein
MTDVEARQSRAGQLTDFLKANAGKLALAGVLLVGAIGIYFVAGSRAPSRSGKVQFVCVATGETFWLARGQSKVLPAVNPKSGAKTLVPCHKSDDGMLYVSSRCRGLVRQLKEDGINQYVDPETLLVRENP